MKWMMYCLLLSCSLPVSAKEKPHAPCTTYLAVMEQDARTVNLKMIGLNKPQLDWYKHNGDRKKYAGVCGALFNPNGKQVPLSVGLTHQTLGNTTDISPLYVLQWEEHLVFVPNNQGGREDYVASGVLSRFDSTGAGTLIPIAPLHNENRTIFTSPSVSLLKEAILELKSNKR